MKLLDSVLPILAWLVSIILTILDWLAVRELVVAIAIRATQAVPMEQQIKRGWFVHNIIPAIDRFAVLGCGVIGFGLVMVFEYIYRNAQAKGVLARRFCLFTGIQVGVYIVCRVLVFVLI
jgi:hypothetical protein